MASFDIVSLFTMVPIKETMAVLRRHFEEDILGPFRHVLTTSNVTFNEHTSIRMAWAWAHRFLLL
jgi:hypothetical protein